MTFERIGVVGAGMMGGEIALVFAIAGHPVLVTDASEDALEKLPARWESVLDKGVARGFFEPAQKALALQNLKTTTAFEDYADRDLVIEAVFEDETIKGGIFRKLDAVCAPDCVLASNTSSIPITVLAANVSAERRSRFLGTHFFSPASRMKLVEVIPGLDTDAAIVDRVMAACRAVGKEPVHIKDVVGFAVNRLLHAFFIEALRLVEEGVATPKDIDIACRLGLGHPVGPFELLDAVTNSLSLQVQEILEDAYGPRFKPRPLLKQMVRAGYDGKKAGRGWYRYKDR